MRERNQKRHLFFSLFRLFHRRVFGGRCRNEIFSFLFSSLKPLYLRDFLELWSCFFLISGREGKWCFFDPQHKASLFTMIFFLFFSPAISDPDAQRECHFEDQREWEGTQYFLPCRENITQPYYLVKQRLGYSPALVQSTPSIYSLQSLFRTFLIIRFFLRFQIILHRHSDKFNSCAALN